MLFNDEEQVVAQQSSNYSNYVGVAAREILCVNPTKKELKELFDRDVEDEPVYKKEVTQDDKTFNRISINVRGRLVPIKGYETNYGEAFLNNTFTLDKVFNVKKDDNNKFQVIDELGQSCWITKDKYQAKDASYIDKNGIGRKFDIDVDSWRPAYVGEVDLVNFFKILFNIPPLRVWDRVQKSFIENPQLNGKIDGAKFWKKEDTEKLLKGDFKELKENVKRSNAKNRVVINYFYTETGSNGSDFQKMLNNKTLSPSYGIISASNKFKKEIDKTIEYYKDNNPDKLSKFDFSNFGVLVKKEVKPTEFNYTIPQEAPTIEDLPVDDSELPF